MQFIGFKIDEDDIEKLKIISFITKKNRTALLREGVEHIVEKYSDSFEKFQNHIEKMRK